MPNQDNLKVYADEECTQPIESFGWGAGKENGAYTAESIAYLKNHANYDIVIRHIELPDKRLKYEISSDIIKPNQVVKLKVFIYINIENLKDVTINKGKIAIDTFGVGNGD